MMRWRDGLVSVIVPAYNAERYIRETILSACAQTYGNMEILVVDDASNDRTCDIVQALSAEYAQVRLIRQRKNEGASAARNVALKQAAGRYVAFLDSDDLWRPRKIAMQLEALKNSPAVMCYTAIEMLDAAGGIRKPARHVPDRATYRTLLCNTVMATSSILIDRRRTGDFSMADMRSGQDYATWLSLLRGDKAAVGINAPLTGYRVHKGSLSANKLKSVGQVYSIQRRQEGIGMLPAALHTGCFCVHAFKKYFL